MAAPNLSYENAVSEKLHFHDDAVARFAGISGAPAVPLASVLMIAVLYRANLARLLTEGRASVLDQFDVMSLEQLG
jgi:hypothetical protein